MALTELEVCRKREHKAVRRRKTRPSYGQGQFSKMMRAKFHQGNLALQAKKLRDREKAEEAAAEEKKKRSWGRSKLESVLHYLPFFRGRGR